MKKSFAAITRLLLFASGLVLLFQNCSSGGGNSVHFQSSNQDVKSGGNGGFYGGKPDLGIYYRYITSGLCGLGDPRLLGRIDVSEVGIQLDAIHLPNCNTTNLFLKPETIEFSRYNPKLIGYSEGVFIRYPLAPERAPTNQVEAWCRKPGSSVQAGLDLVIERDSDTGVTFSKILMGSVSATGEQISSESSPASVQRQVIGSRVQYTAPDFHLEIGSSQSAGSKFQAVLKSSIGSQAMNESLECRLAGALDPNEPSKPTLAWTVPGKVEAENYNVGGEGVGYHDVTPGDSGGQNTRGDDVDVIAVTLGRGVSSAEAGEWLKYNVDATSAGTYEIAIGIDRTMTSDPAALKVEIDGVDVTGNVDIPVNANTPGTYPITRLPAFQMSQGLHTVKVMIERGILNMNHMTFTRTGP